MIPQDFIQQLLARVDIVDVVGRHVKLRKAGANFVGLCPFHGEKTASFTVSPTKQFYHCFGCGVHGSAIGFLMEQTGLGYVDAIRDLAREAGLSVPESRDIDPAAAAAAASESANLLTVLQTAAGHYQQRLRDSPRAIDYLKARSVTGEIAARFGIGYAPAQWRALEAAVADYSAPALATAGLVIDAAVDDVGETPGVGDGTMPAPLTRARRYDRFRDRIMFPIRNPRGQVIGFGGRVLDGGEPKYLNSPETPVFSKGRELYGLFEARDAIRREDCVVVVEGYMDVVTLARHGVGNAVAALGTATTADHVRKLVRLANRLVFAFDGDSAGRRAAWRALGVCLPHTSDTRQIDFLFLPAEHDPDSFVRERGIDGWRECLARTVPLSEVLLRELSAQVELATPEGRAKLLAQARPLITGLAAPALRLQIVHRLATLAALGVAEVERYFAPPTRPGDARGSGTRTPGDRSGSMREGGAERGSGPWRASTGGASPGDGRGPVPGWQRSSRDHGGRNQPGRPSVRREASSLHIPAAAPNLEARARLLLALHPGLAARLDNDPGWLPGELVEWIGWIAALPQGCTFASVCEAVRERDAATAARLERDGSIDSAGLAELTAEQAAMELEGALGQLKQRWAKQQIEQMVAVGIASEEDRKRYAELLKMTRFMVK